MMGRSSSTSMFSKASISLRCHGSIPLHPTNTSAADDAVKLAPPFTAALGRTAKKEDAATALHITGVSVVALPRGGTLICETGPSPGYPPPVQEQCCTRVDASGGSTSSSADRRERINWRG